MPALKETPVTAVLDMPGYMATANEPDAEPGPDVARVLKRLVPTGATIWTFRAMVTEAEPGGRPLVISIHAMMPRPLVFVTKTAVEAETEDAAMMVWLVLAFIDSKADPLYCRFTFDAIGPRASAGTALPKKLFAMIYPLG